MKICFNPEGFTLKNLLGNFLFSLPIYFYQLYPHQHNNFVELILLFSISIYFNIYGKIIRRGVLSFLFYWYTTHMLLGERSFAYLGFFDRLFVTEITIGILVSGILYLKLFKPTSSIYAPFPLIICSLLVFYSLIVGNIYFPSYGLSALRDSLMLGYLIWVPITYFIVSQENSLELLLKIIFLCSVIKAFQYSNLILHLLITDNLFADNDRLRFDVGYAIPAWTLIIFLTGYNYYQKKLVFIPFLMGMACITIGHRSIILGLVIISFLYLIMGTKNLKQKVLKFYLVSTLFIISSSILLYLFYNFNILSIVIQKINLHEGNLNYRYIAWGYAFERFINHWLLGFDVGHPLFFELGGDIMYFLKDTVYNYWQIRDGNGNAQPHNSYLNILTRFGIIIFMVFLLNILYTLYRAFKMIPKLHPPFKNDLLISLGLFIFMLVFDFFNVGLESPHNSFETWFAFGILLCLLTKKERKIVSAPNMILI